MPEDRQLSCHVHRRVEGVSPIAKDREKKGRSQSVAEVGGETHSRGGESFDCYEGGLGLSQPLDEVEGGC